MITTERTNTGFREPAENHTVRFERTAARERLPYHVALAIGRSGPSAHPPDQNAEDDFKDVGAGI